LEQDRLAVVDGTFNPGAGSQEAAETASRPAGQAQWRLQVIERIAIVRFADSELLVGETIARELARQLKHFVEAEGHSRLLLNLSGVRYLSSEMLAALVSFQQRVDRRGGCVQLCGLEPLMRDLLRTSRVEHLFDICADEAEALGILIR
jgi:anti-sigma B factor antagonist